MGELLGSLGVSHTGYRPRGKALESYQRQESVQWSPPLGSVVRVSELAENLSWPVLGPNLPINARSLGSSGLVTWRPNCI